MKTYGIYLAYPPTVDLRSEGLGRHLAEFLKGAQERGDIRFVIACPSWMRASLMELFEASNVQADSFEVIAPNTKPLILRLHERYMAFVQRRKKQGRVKRFLKYLRASASVVTNSAERKIVSTRSILRTIAFGIVALPFLTASALLAKIVGLAWGQLRHLAHRAWASVAKYFDIKTYVSRLERITAQPKGDSGIVRWYRLMLDAEVSLMHNLINSRSDVRAWYSPTAFWPHFNEINAPRLMCVPDVVLANFPIGFSGVGGDRFVDNFRQVESAIYGGEHFVTYSEDVKWRTLVDRYDVAPQSVSVVLHGANRLDDLAMVSGTPDREAATDSLCRKLFNTALRKIVNNEGLVNYSGSDIRFMFYASQFRPNKNVITLLRAYKYLLRDRHIGHKLVLTGNPNVLPEIGHYIRAYHLENDVLCLHGLSAQELAACYRLADLAVNPSLSEGGCPFTFTEALSVGTPVVMARIPVTEEVINSPQLQDVMLFDPYDWKDMANRIEWGLINSQLLLVRQQPFYDQVAQRTWRNVVDEYVAILDRISSNQKVVL